MDLNELLRAHQIEVMKAGEAKSEQSRESHFDQVALFAEQIRALRKTPHRVHQSSRAGSEDTVIYGTYAWDSAPKMHSTIGSWENEGGALNPSEIPLPAGTTLKLPPSYFVGSDEYSDLRLAVSAHLQQRQKPQPPKP